MHKRVDIASLVFFRVVFGLLVAYQTTEYFRRDWIDFYFVEPAFHFTYPGTI